MKICFHLTVEKRKDISHEVAAVSVCAGVAAYTAVHYLGHVTAGDTVLVMDGATPQGLLTIQLAQSFGAKVNFLNLSLDFEDQCLLNPN